MGKYFLLLFINLLIVGGEGGASDTTIEQPQLPTDKVVSFVFECIENANFKIKVK